MALPMKKTDCAYYAGIFDGEGTIGMYAIGKKTLNQRRTYCLRVQVVSTDEWIIQSLKFAFGGNIFIEARKNNPRWATAYRWFLQKRRTIGFLETILPYLRLKRPQAELALKYLRHKTAGGYKPQGYIDLEEDFKSQFSTLNKTGKKSGDTHRRQLCQTQEYFQ